MGRMVFLGNAKGVNKDIELCWTTNERSSEQAVEALISRQIPFSKSWVSIPFFLRIRFHGAKQFCIISTNPNRYSQARQAIDSLDPYFRRRLVVSNY